MREQAVFKLNLNSDENEETDLTISIETLNLKTLSCFTEKSLFVFMLWQFSSSGSKGL